MRPFDRTRRNGSSHSCNGRTKSATKRWRSSPNDSEQDPGRGPGEVGKAQVRSGCIVACMERIKASRGPKLRCKGWRQEAILRMLENNLENAEKPDQLIIYGGTGRTSDPRGSSRVRTRPSPHVPGSISVAR